MKRIVEWLGVALEDGLDFVIYEDLISFYAYFSTVFAEIAILWAFFPTVSLTFTILLLSCVMTVLVCSFYKGRYMGEMTELFIAIEYVFALAVIFINGLVINWLFALILFTLPFIVSAIWVAIRRLQNIELTEDEPKIIIFIHDMFENSIIWTISQIILIGVPFLVFSWAVAQNRLPSGTTFVLIMMFIFFIPITSYLEDELGAQNVFEIAYAVYWDKEYEEEKQRFEKER